MSGEFNELISDYDLIIDKMNRVKEEALAYHSTNPLRAHSSIAAMIANKLKAAIDILIID